MKEVWAHTSQDERVSAVVYATFTAFIATEKPKATKSQDEASLLMLERSEVRYA